MKLPKKLRKAAIRAHHDGTDATEFVGKHHAAIQKAARGSCEAYRVIRCELMRLLVSGPDAITEGARL